MTPAERRGAARRGGRSAAQGHDRPAGRRPQAPRACAPSTARRQLLAGKDDDGVATLDRLLHDTTDPSALNSAAYALADAGKELPLADTTERSVLAGLDTETRTWTGDESARDPRRQTSLLVCLLGHHGLDPVPRRQARRGREPTRTRPSSTGPTPRSAPTWATSARPRATPPARAALYQLAPGHVLPLPRRPAVRRRASARSKLEAMKKAGAHPEPAGDLDDLRKVHLGPATAAISPPSTASCSAAGKVESADPTGEKSVRGGAELHRGA